MKKRRHKLLILLFLLCLPFTLSGCFLNSTVLAVDQTMPKTPKLALAPFWVFDQAYSLDPDNQDIDGDYFKGLGMILSGEVIQIGTDTVSKPSIKVMRIKTYDYFLTRYKIAPQQVGLTDSEMVLYTITDAKGFSARIYRVNDNRVALERNNILLYFNQTEELTDTGIIVKTDSTGNPSSTPPSNANGVMIGLRGQRETDKDGVFGPSPYRTLWITQKRGHGVEVYEVPDILFPRNVFYQLKVERQENIDVVRETLVLKNLADQTVTREAAPPQGLSRFSDITFVSNDYLSVAGRLNLEKDQGEMNLYSTRNIANLMYENRVGITDLFGPEGLPIMKSAANIAIANAKPAQVEGLGPMQENSFILKRYNGRWIYEGRINSADEESDKGLTFPMNFRDNVRVYRYDTLEPNWSQIRNSVPAALDAVSSPDDFFTVVRTKDELLIYSKDPSGNLLDSPIAKIDLQDEEIIMHEWALGNFVDDWSTIVKQLGQQIQ